MGEKENYELWGLSLSLKPPITHNDHKLTTTRKREPQSFADKQSPKVKKPYNKELMMPRVNTRMKPPLLAKDLKEVEITGNKVVSSPNSTTLSSSVTAKRMAGEKEMIRGDDDGGTYGGEKTKLRLINNQIMVLEQAFMEHSTLNTKQKVALSRQVNLRPRQVEVWFQNRRARVKSKKREAENEYLRELCESLSKVNKKLKKEVEVEELRAMKSLRQAKANHTPTTLTLCPSCKSVSSSLTTTKTPAVI